MCSIGEYVLFREFSVIMKKTTDLLKKNKRLLAERKADSGKGDYGRLLIIGGSDGMAGAAYCSGLAAFRSGIGMVRFYGPECNRVILQTLLPEAMYSTDSVPGEAAEKQEKIPVRFENLDRALQWADYVVCGPGLSRSDYAITLTEHLWKLDLSEKKLVLFDADALNIIAAGQMDLKGLSCERIRKGSRTNVVITPHVGEMSRLTGRSIEEIKNKPAELACAYAREHDCIVALKDAVSYVAFPDGDCYRNISGSPALAKAGSGDVLTGVIAGITAIIRGDASAGTIIGVYVHGRAGELAEAVHGVHSVLARDVADAIGGVLSPVSPEFEHLYLFSEKDDGYDSDTDCGNTKKDKVPETSGKRTDSAETTG